MLSKRVKLLADCFCRSKCGHSSRPLRKNKKKCVKLLQINDNVGEDYLIIPPAIEDINLVLDTYVYCNNENGIISVNVANRNKLTLIEVKDEECEAELDDVTKDIFIRYYRKCYLFQITS